MTVLMTRLMYCLSCFGPLDRFWEDAGIPALDLFCHKHSKIYCSSSNSSAHPGTRHASKNVNDVFSITWSFGEIHFNIEKKNAIFSSIITDPMVVFGSLEFFHERKAKKIICIILSMRTILLIVYVFLLLIIIIIFYIR